MTFDRIKLDTLQNAKRMAVKEYTKGVMRKSRCEQHFAFLFGPVPF
ncbi:hypothetical protein ACSSVY_004009 [Roseovarius sp. MBR-51]